MILKKKMDLRAHMSTPRGNIHVYYHNIQTSSPCADPEIFMRGGPTKIVIFGHRRGGVQPQKNPEITFF